MIIIVWEEVEVERLNDLRQFIWNFVEHGKNAGSFAGHTFGYFMEQEIETVKCLTQFQNIC